MSRVCGTECSAARSLPLIRIGGRDPPASRGSRFRGVLADSSSPATFEGGPSRHCNHIAAAPAIPGAKVLSAPDAGNELITLVVSAVDLHPAEPPGGELVHVRAAGLLAVARTRRKCAGGLFHALFAVQVCCRQLPKRARCCCCRSSDSSTCGSPHRNPRCSRRSRLGSTPRRPPAGAAERLQSDPVAPAQDSGRRPLAICVDSP